MHIEPGLLAPTKVLLANVSALGLLGLYAQGLLKQPADLIRTLIGALFFSVFMQGFHLPVGPSELHFVGAMAIYLTLGFLPTLYGFALGLLLQGLLFDPLDLQHLAVNALSLILPLLAVHYGLDRQLREATSGKRIGWATSRARRPLLQRRHPHGRLLAAGRRGGDAPGRLGHLRDLLPGHRRHRAPGHLRRPAAAQAL